MKTRGRFMYIKDNLKRLSLHVAAWSCFIAYEVGVSISMGGKVAFYVFACFYALNISLFYFNVFAVTTLSDKKRALWIILAAVVLELLLYTILSIGIDILLTTIRLRRLTIDTTRMDFIRSLWRGVYFIGLSMGYYLGKRNIVNAKRAYELLVQKSESARREAALENDHLRAQINPHMLYNVLHFIYVRVEEVSPQAAQCVSLLIQSMRYASARPQKDGLVALQMEIAQIERLLQLSQLLAKGKLLIKKEIDDHCYNTDLPIPPLLLFTFVENIFKHGNLIDAPAIIRISEKNNQLQFHTENLKANRRTYASENVGMENARARLEKYFSNNFILESRQIESNFIVDLTINFEYSLLHSR